MVHFEDYDRIVFFTGAGMSKESGIETFRGPGGMWSRYDPDEVACQEAFERDPDKVLDFHDVRRQMMSRAEPHRGHQIIAELERTRSVTVITQNIDGLHQLGGSQDVVELHGSVSLAAAKS